jgi:hypothetical protein
MPIHGKRYALLTHVNQTIKLLILMENAKIVLNFSAQMKIKEYVVNVIQRHRLLNFMELALLAMITLIQMMKPKELASQIFVIKIIKPYRLLEDAKIAHLVNMLTLLKETVFILVFNDMNLFHRANISDTSLWLFKV